MTDDPTPRAGLPLYHTIGIGAGPANLSLAALFGSATEDRLALFERQNGPSWHDKLLHSGVRMQTSWLKDLVSAIDPRHELSFLNYLVTTDRLYALLNAQFDVIPRLEYVRYLAWAAGKLGNVHYGREIDRISFDDGFVVHANGRPLARSEHLVLGVGTRPFIPPELTELPPHNAFIADELAERLEGTSEGTTGELAHANAGTPIAVVGGNQTGIEATLRLLGQGFTNIKWFGKHLWFQTIDDSPCANDVYRPAHMRALQRLSAPTRQDVVEGLKLTGDALTPGALRTLYQENYERFLELGHFPVTLYPARNVTAGHPEGNDVVLDCSTSEGHEQHRVRHVVIATGRENFPIPFDDELRERVDIGEDGEPIIEPDFSVRWKGMNGHRIYALNRGRFTHGLTDLNLTLLPVRSAIVLNSMFGREVFRVADELCPVDWG